MNTNITSTIVKHSYNELSYIKMFAIWFELIEPDIIILGVIMNFLVFYVMPRKGVTIGASLKIYFSIIAIANFLELIFKNFQYTILIDSMYDLLIYYLY